MSLRRKVATAAEGGIKLIAELYYENYRRLMHSQVTN